MDVRVEPKAATRHTVGREHVVEVARAIPPSTSTASGWTVSTLLPVPRHQVLTTSTSAGDSTGTSAVVPAAKRPSSSPAVSLIVMPVLGVAKKRLGAGLDSGATAGEGVQNLICAAQAGAVLLGPAGTAALGWTWLDPATALLLAGWVIREGLEAWRGDDCC